jgi:hypothetical protein
MGVIRECILIIWHFISIPIRIAIEYTECL